VDLPKVKNLVVAVDTETSGLHPDDGARVSVVSLCWGGQSRVLPFDQGMLPDKVLPRGYQKSLFDEDPGNLSESDWVELLAWLGDQWLVFHNAKFDLMMLKAGTRHFSGVDLDHRLLGCTAVGSALIYPSEKVGLKDTASRLWGIEERTSEKQVKGWFKGKKTKRYDLVPWDLMSDYARVDAELCFRLWDHLVEIKNTGFVAPEIWAREMELIRVLYKMEQRGIGFDISGSLDAASLLHHEQMEVYKSIPFRPVTEAGARKYFFDQLGNEPLKTTNSGLASVDKESVGYLVELDQPGAAEYDRYTKLGYAQSMWYGSWPTLVGDDGRLRPVFHQTKTEEGRGAVTGRLSVQRIQLQAVPHDYRLGWLPDGVPAVRKLIRPADGRKLFELDMSQAEMRVAAGVSGCKSLIDAFARGEDAHDATCRLVFKVDVGDDDWEFLRSIAKRLNFGMLYGAGVATVQRQIKENTGIDVSNSQVKEWISDYKLAMPEVVRFSKKINYSAERNRFIVLANGRVRWFNQFEPTHKAFNALIQGGVAEVMKLAMLKIERVWPGVLLLQIHDSVVIEVSKAQEKAGVVLSVRNICSDLFEETFGLGFVTDCKEWK